MTAVAPDTTRDESSRHLALLLGSQLSTGLLRFGLERLESLLLDIGDGFDDEDADEDDGEDCIVNSERGRDEFRRVSGSEGEEKVLRKLPQSEEDVLGDSDEEDVDWQVAAPLVNEGRPKSRIDQRNFHPIQFIFCFWYSQR